MCAFVLFWVSFPDAWTAFASSEGRGGGGGRVPTKKTNTYSNPVNKKTHPKDRGHVHYIRKIYRLFHGKQWSVPGLFMY